MLAFDAFAMRILRKLEYFLKSGVQNRGTGVASASCKIFYAVYDLSVTHMNYSQK
jgi:hypothetical protein